MRKYNQANQNKLQYYGIDIGGFYQNWKNPMDLIFNYLEKVDSTFAATLIEQLAPYITVMTENAREKITEKVGD